jgi:hypothetical protein
VLLERKELKDAETQEIYVEALYDSTNLMKTIYLPQRKMLFVFFKKGVVYSYANVDSELYLGLENADSQGVYFSKSIVKNTKCVHYREYKLYDFEKKDMLKLIEEQKQLLGENNQF